MDIDAVYDAVAARHGDMLADRAEDRYDDLLRERAPGKGARVQAMTDILLDYEQPAFADEVETAARDYLRDLQALDPTDDRVHIGDYYGYERTAYSVQQFEDHIDLSGSDWTVEQARSWIRTQADADTVFLDGVDPVAVAFREAAEQTVLESLEEQEHPHIDADAARQQHVLRYAMIEALR